MTIQVYDKHKQYQVDGTAPVDWNTDTIKVALVSSSYTPSITADDYFSDVSAYEVSGTNYTAGGAIISNISVSVASNKVVVDGDDVSWASNAGGFTNARYAIIYKATGTASTSPLIGYINFTGDRGNTIAPLLIVWSSSGIITYG